MTSSYASGDSCPSTLPVLRRSTEAADFPVGAAKYGRRRQRLLGDVADAFVHRVLRLRSHDARIASGL
jgi:hypothetical protein